MGAQAPLAAIGETFALRTRLTADAIRDFATSVGDHNPLHHDVAAARAAGYDGLIASGTQLGSILMAMTATHFAQPGAGGRPRLSLGLGFELTFRGPVFADEDIDLRWTVTGVSWKESLVGWITLLAGDARAGERLLLAATGTLLVRAGATR
jgi:acyl dehydratase